jgi:hypothetical protein
MGGGENQGLAQIYAASGSPRLRRVLPGIDRVEAQGIISGIGLRVGKSGRCQSRRCQEESDREAQH